MKADYETQQTQWMAEREREERFRLTGPYYHLYTAPIQDRVLISDKETRDIAITYLAIAAHETDVSILVYAIMSNHFHVLLQGKLNRCLSFFDRFRYLFDLYLTRHNHSSLFKSVRPGCTEITTVRQFRDEVAYVLRNPFVVRTDINPLNNEWTSAHLYFTPRREDPSGLRASSLTIRQKRGIMKSTLLSVPDQWLFLDGHVNPVSFVDVEMVEYYFAHARQFVFSLFRNTERQVELAMSHGENPILPDEELLPIVYRLCRDRYNSSGPYKMQDVQKKELAVELRRKYYCSTSQIARLTGLSLPSLESMFPSLQ